MEAWSWAVPARAPGAALYSKLVSQYKSCPLPKLLQPSWARRRSGSVIYPSHLQNCISRTHSMHAYPKMIKKKRFTGDLVLVQASNKRLLINMKAMKNRGFYNPTIEYLLYCKLFFLISYILVLSAIFWACSFELAHSRIAYPHIYMHFENLACTRRYICMCRDNMTVRE